QAIEEARTELRPLREFHARLAIADTRVDDDRARVRAQDEDVDRRAQVGVFVAVLGEEPVVRAQPFGRRLREERPDHVRAVELVDAHDLDLADERHASVSRSSNGARVSDRPPSSVTRIVSSSRTPAPPRTPGTQIRGSTANVIPSSSTTVSAPGRSSPMYGGSFAPIPTPWPMKRLMNSLEPKPRAAAASRTARATSSFVLPARSASVAAASASRTAVYTSCCRRLGVPQMTVRPMSPKYPDHIAPMSMKTTSPLRMILSEGIRFGGAMCSPEATNGVATCESSPPRR